jgi:hypothetical protein
LQRRYSFFTEGKWTPLIPTWLNRVYASQWELDGKKLWTLTNRQEQWAKGTVFADDFAPGMKYYDLITGKEIKTTTADGKTFLFIELKPKAIGGILSIPEKERCGLLCFPAKPVYEIKIPFQRGLFSIPSSEASKNTSRYSKKVQKAWCRYPYPGAGILNFSFRQRDVVFTRWKASSIFTAGLSANPFGTRKNLKTYAMDETTAPMLSLNDSEDSKYKPAARRIS